MTLQCWLPFLGEWPPLNRDILHADPWTGLTGAVIVLPQRAAFAMLAGLPPEIRVLYRHRGGPVRFLLAPDLRPTAAISSAVFSAMSVLAPLGSEKFVQLAITLACLNRRNPT